MDREKEKGEREGERGREGGRRRDVRDEKSTFYSCLWSEAGSLKEKQHHWQETQLHQLKTN